MKTGLRRLLLLAALLTLGACELDSDSSSGAREPMEGRAVKGILQGASVTAYSREGTQWAFAGVVYTDAQGDFVFEDGLPAGIVKIVIEAAADGSSRMVCDAAAGCGVAGLEGGDLNANGFYDFGEPVPLPADFRLTAILPASRPGDASIAVTPITHMAAAFIEELPGGVTEQAVTVALAQVAALFALPQDFAYQRPLDVTDPDELSSGSSGQIQHALLAAGFAELAAGVAIQTVLDNYAQTLVGMGGQLPLTGEGSLDALAAAAEAVLAAASSGEMTLSQALQSLQEMAQRWTGSYTQVSTSSDYVPADLDRARVVLDDLDHYLNLAGIDESGQFFASQAYQVDWLYNEDTAGLVQASLQAVTPVVLLALMEDVLVDQMGAVLDLTGMLNDGVNTPAVVFDTQTRLLTIQGTLSGQSMDISVDMANLLLQANGGVLDYALSGSVANAVTAGELNGTLSIDLYETNLLPVLTVAHALAAGSATEAELLAELQALLPLLNARATLSGEGRLYKVADPTFGFSGNLTAWGEIDMPALQSGEAVVKVHLTEGRFTGPAGDSIYTLSGQPGMHLEVGSTAALTADFGFEAFGMPAMEVSLDGTLAEVGAVVGELAAAVEASGPVDMESLVVLVSQLDLSVLDLQGTGALTIPSAAKTWSFALDNNRLDVSLPNSIETALNFHLASLGGGYLYSGESLVATVTFDWANTGASIYFVDGEVRQYFLGPLEDILDPAVLGLLFGNF